MVWVAAVEGVADVGGECGDVVGAEGLGALGRGVGGEFGLSAVEAASRRRWGFDDGDDFFEGLDLALQGCSAFACDADPGSAALAGGVFGRRNQSGFFQNTKVLAQIPIGGTESCFQLREVRARHSAEQRKDA